MLKPEAPIIFRDVDLCREDDDDDGGGDDDDDDDRSTLRTGTLQDISVVPVSISYEKLPEVNFTGEQLVGVSMTTIRITLIALFCICCRHF